MMGKGYNDKKMCCNRSICDSTLVIKKDLDIKKLNVG